MSVLLKLWKEYMLYLETAGTSDVDKRCIVLEEQARALGDRLQLRDLGDWARQKSNNLDRKRRHVAISVLEKTSQWRNGQGYQYTPLPRGGPFFRYLLLEPAEDPEADLICSLHVGSLNDAPEFEAISYVWGSCLKTRHVICDGSRLDVTENLSIALRQCRWRDRPRALWSDAICINQSDNAEKGWQVALMGRIYTESTCTLICLRPLFIDWPDAPKTIGDASSLIRDIDAMMKSGMDGDDAPEAPGGVCTRDSERLLMSDERWSSMWEIVNTRWFERCWAIQEAALGRRCTIIIGHDQEEHRIEWLGFLKAWAWYRQRGGEKPKKVWYWRPLSRLHEDKLLREENEAPFLTNASSRRLSFLDQLHEVRNYRFKASDNRDRVYSLMGLPSVQELGLSLEPDYSKPYLHAYQQLARSYMEQTSDLSILHYVDNYNFDLSADKKRLVPSVNPYTASWYPRWHRLAAHPIFSSAVMTRRKRPAQPVAVRFEGDTLITRGTIIDTVTFTSKHFETLKRREVGIRSISQVRTVWRHVQKTCRGQQSPYISPLSVFVHCLMLGASDVEQDSWLEHIREYKRYLDPQCSELEPRRHEEENSPSGSARINGDPMIIQQRIRSMACRRRFALTSRGYFAMVPIAAREGDSLCVITATNTVFVLRRVKDCAEERYQLAGSAFVPCRNIFRDPEAGHTLGYNEKCEDWKDWGLQDQDIYIR